MVIKDIVNSIKKLFSKTEEALIRVGLSESITISEELNREAFVMPFNVVRQQVGNLTFDQETNEIVIGENINAILVNVQVYFYSTADITQPKIINIMKKDAETQEVSTMISSRVGLVFKQTTCKTSCLVQVKKDDRIHIRVTGNANDPINNNSVMTLFETIKIN